MRRRRTFPFASALLALAAGLWLFYKAHHALIPFILAAAFAYVLNPAVTYFEAKGMRRAVLVVVGYLGVVLLGVGAYAGLRPLVADQVDRLVAEAPGYYQQLQKIAVQQQARLIKDLPLPKKVSEEALDSAIGGALHTVQALPSQLLSLLPFLAHALLVPFIGFFFLLDGGDGVDHLIQVTPSRYVEQTIHLLSEVDTALGNYLRGIIIVAMAITVASFIGLVAMGVDNALAISVLSGVSSFVPYLGAVIGSIVGGGMAIYQFGTFWAGVKVVLLFLGIRLADEIFLQPVIARHSVHLHPMVFLLALILGGEFFGFLGLVFAVPAACIIKALLKVGWSWYTSETGLDVLASADGASVPYT